MVTYKLQEVNASMGAERIKTNNANILNTLPQDIIYKLGLELYGRRWTLERINTGFIGATHTSSSCTAR